MSASPFAGLAPSLVWKHFEALTQLARPSGNEDAAADYVVEWAQAQGFDHEIDAAGNVYVNVPGSAGRESAPVVVIQGHLDMVCERNADSPYDAAEGRLHVTQKDGWITAEGTTLGADNGLGVAAGMAAADDPEMKHGPLQLIMTRDEETGLTGAKGLEAARIHGRVMLNLDSEEDGMLFVGCAGGCDTHLSIPAPQETPPGGWTPVRIELSGMLGGHSGLDIHRNRCNAIKAAVRLATAGMDAAPARLARLDGGSMRNAIPREAAATLFVEPGQVDAFGSAFDAARAALREEFAAMEPGMKLELVTEGVEAPASCLRPDAADAALRLLRSLPSGVISLSQDIEGLVETSTNLGVVTTEGESLKVIMCSRSSVAAAIQEMLDRLAAMGTMGGAHVEHVGGYPGWKPDMDSKALATTKLVYERAFGHAPVVTAIHAGLECGLIGERVPGMDMISFGPEIRGAHSPDERVQIESVGRFWNLLGGVLDQLSS